MLHVLGKLSTFFVLQWQPTCISVGVWQSSGSFRTPGATDLVRTLVFSKLASRLNPAQGAKRKLVSFPEMMGCSPQGEALSSEPLAGKNFRGEAEQNADATRDGT